MSVLIFLAISIPIVALVVLCDRALSGQFETARTLSSNEKRGR